MTPLPRSERDRELLALAVRVGLSTVRNWFSDQQKLLVHKGRCNMPLPWVETDEDGNDWYQLPGTSMLTFDGSRCRMWLDDHDVSCDEEGRVVLTLNQLYFDCVDCHALVHLGDFIDGACVRDGFAPDRRGE